MQETSLSWLQISNQIQEKQFLDDHIKRQITQLLVLEKQERSKKNIDILKTQLPVKNGRLLPNFQGIATYKYRGGKGPIKQPHGFPMPLSCDSNYNLIASQLLNYTAGSSPVEGVIPFDADNKPSIDNDTVIFENHQVYHTDTVRGEISLAGVTGYGNIPSEVLFPGKGLSFHGDLVHAFQVPGANLANYRVIQASARISNNTPTVWFDAGPVNSEVNGLVGLIGMITISLLTYDPATGHYTSRSSSSDVFECIAYEGTESGYGGNLFGRPQIEAPAGTAIYQFGAYGTSDGSIAYGKVDMTTNCPYTPSDKPIYVDVSIDMYAILMIGNEKVSGIIVNCQGTGATPVATSNDSQKINFMGSPFLVEEMRICGI